MMQESKVLEERYVMEVPRSESPFAELSKSL
jgi:hypothetical protein